MIPCATATLTSATLEIFRQQYPLDFLSSAHPQTPDETKCVSDLETSNFLPDQGNQAFERRRSAIRRTNKCAD